MIENLFITLVGISVTTGLVILLLKLSSGLFNKTYAAKWKYWIWLILALRLIIPFNFSFPAPPMTVNIPNTPMPAFVNTVSMQQNTTMPPAQTEQVMTNIPVPLTQTNPITLINILILIWAIGAVLFLTYQFIGYLLFKKKALRWSKEPTDARIMNTLRGIAADMGVKKEIPVLISKSISSPLMTGFLKPLLFLPNESYSDTDLNFILRHELTHYKRRDLWYKLFLIIVSAVHWFNPFMYLLFREASADLELSCDDKVINGLSNDERRSYSETILASITAQKSLQTVLSTNFYGGQKTLKNRFANIFNTKKKRNGATALLAVMLTVGILGGLITSKVDISENKLLTKLGYTKTLLTDILDNRTTFSQDNEHINHIIKSLPLQDDSEYKSFSLEDGQTKEINYAYEFDGGSRNAADPFYGMIWEYDALLLFASVEGLEKVNFLHYVDQTRLFNTDSYTIDDLAARFGINKPWDLGFSDLFNTLATNVLWSEDYFGYPSRIFLGYSFENVSDRYGDPDEIWPQPDGSTVLKYTEYSVLTRKSDISMEKNEGYTAMYYFNNPIAETNDNLTGLYATRFVRGTTYGKTYGDITEQLGLPPTIKIMGDGDKYIAYPLREGQQRHAYFILHDDEVVEEGLMYGNDYTILDFKQKTSESDATNNG
ncbi:M56 family metallopeptidase [Paenibacillus sp. GCM10027626]|uniref:M56 family metallopeptidase n=1 Tax=Paenibacillus sp. GCM10027626 TaxID=3273411 RepID=UPI00362FEF56